MTEKKKEQATVKIKKTVLPKSKMKLVFSVPAEKFEKMASLVANELSLKMKFDGFRQGKVPEKIVEKTVGKELFLEKMTERAVKKFYVDGILDEKIQVIGSPEIKIINQKRNEELVFEAEVFVYPMVDLKNWRAEAKRVNAEFIDQKIVVTDKEIQKELNFLANQRAKTVLVNRPSKMKDQVEIDFEVIKDGVIIEGGLVKKYILILGENKFIPGFEKEIVGLKAGENKEFKLFFPKEYHSKFLAGKEALFKVRVNNVWERISPEINDEFARGIGNFENLEKLSTNIKEGIIQEKENALLVKKQTAVLEKLIASCEVEIPEILIISEAEKMFAELISRLAGMGMSKDDYLKQIGIKEEDLKKKWQEKEAIKRVKAGLIINQISKEEKIEPENKEIEEKLNLFLRYFKNIKSIEESQLDLKGLYERARGELVNEKVLEYLLGL